MSELDPQETTTVTQINHYCHICAATMYHGEWNGMIGWVCPDPECYFFEPD